MASNLLITVLGGRTLLQIHTFQNCVLPEFILDGQHGFLHLSLPIQFYLLLLALRFNGVIISEKIHLLAAHLAAWHLIFGEHMASNDVQASHQQVRINNSVIEC